MGVLVQVRRRRVAAVGIVVMLSVPAGAVAAPASPLQEEGSEGSEEAATDHAVVEIDVDVAEASPDEIAGASGDLLSNVSAQLEQLTNAQAALTNAVNLLADKASAVSETELLLEELTLQMDEVVVSAFMNPPAMNALEVLDAESAVDATITQTMLDMNADENADVLARHEQARSDLEAQVEEQEAAAADAETARANAEAALADLQAAVDQQTQFILELRARLDDPETVNDPALQEDVEALRTQLTEIEEAEAAAEAAEALRQQRLRASGQGGWIVCPVDSPNLNFVDTWGAARSGGRSHKGTDMMAPRNSPTLAPVSGQVVHRSTSLGGASWYIYDDNGDFYYGTHLQAYENEGVGFVEAGTIIGYVGTSGNAPESAPHLHFEYHPGGGSAINPYPLLDNSCPSH